MMICVQSSISTNVDLVFLLFKVDKLSGVSCMLGVNGFDLTSPMKLLAM